MKEIGEEEDLVIGWIVGYVKDAANRIKLNEDYNATSAQNPHNGYIARTAQKRNPYWRRT